jgi:hypothetical protein
VLREKGSDRCALAFASVGLFAAQAAVAAPVKARPATRAARRIDQQSAAVRLSEARGAHRWSRGIPGQVERRGCCRSRR